MSWRSSEIEKVISAVAFYWVVSISLVYLNKLAMNAIDAPLFMTWTQTVITVFGCYFLSLNRKIIPGLEFFPVFQFKPKIALQVLPLTIAFVGMIVFNNLTIKYSSIAFYQVARSLTIVFNIVLSYLVLGDGTSARACAAVGIVVGGYILGCRAEFSTSDVSQLSAIFGVVSSTFVSLYSISVAKILPQVDNNKWILMMYNNANAALLMPAFIVSFGEVPVITTSPLITTMKFWLSHIWLPGITGTLIAIATFTQIQATSPLTHNISGTAKSAFQTLLAVVFKGEELIATGAVGLAMVLGGSLLYSYVRMRDKDKKSRASISPKESNPLLPVKLESIGKTNYNAR